MKQHLSNLFLSVLVHEPSAIEQINAYQGNLYMENGCLVFSLAALHELLNQSSDEKMDYLEFRKMLYQGTLNQDLKAHGVQVAVHRSSGKVETNLYRLERCAPESAQSGASDG